MSTSTPINEQDLARQVSEATPGQLVAMLLGAAQRFLGQAVQAMARKDHAAKGQALIRVSDIIDELSARLNRENGGEVAENLARIYNWWTCELVLASLQNEPGPFEDIGRWMGELGASWEQAEQMRLSSAAPPPAQLAGSPA